MSNSRRRVMKQGKGLVRAASRRGTESGKAARCERQNGRPAEPTMCQTCGALFSRRVWRPQRKVAEAPVRPVVWAECPACKEMRRGEYWGRVLIRGEYAASNEAQIRQRIRNVVEQARSTQPERRLVSAARDGNVLTVLTTSQKLAHRIVRELKKAFGGRARYQWSDDGSLFALWERDA